jgi:hypothetical protein
MDFRLRGNDGRVDAKDRDVAVRTVRHSPVGRRSWRKNATSGIDLG